MARVWQWVREKTQTFSGLRDVVLAAAGICYGVGFLLWSVNAWYQNLGILPALRFQYLIAGAVPVLFVLLLSGVMLALFWLRARIAGWLAQPTGIAPRVHAGLLILVPASLVVFVLTGSDWVEERNWAWSERVQMTSVVTFFVLGFLLPPPSKKGSWVDIVRKGSTFYAVLVAIIAGLGGLIWFFLEAYPAIPQELGGVRPRQAVVYLATDARLPDGVLAALKPSTGNTGDEEGVSASDARERAIVGAQEPLTVDVYFADGNVLLVKRVGERRHFRSPTHEIRRRNVAAISWGR